MTSYWDRCETCGRRKDNRAQQDGGDKSVSLLVTNDMTHPLVALERDVMERVTQQENDTENNAEETEGKVPYSRVGRSWDQPCWEARSTGEVPVGIPDAELGKQDTQNIQGRSMHGHCHGAR